MAVAAVPALFNPRGQDAFSAIKAALLEAFGPLAALCAAFALWSERERLRVGLLLVSCGLVALAYVLATILGVAPTVSFFAPGARHDGTYVALALVAIAFAVAALEADRLDAVVTAIIVGSIGPSMYAIVQASAGITDPVAGEWLPRVGSTFGNPVLLGGYLVAVIPITAARALSAWTTGGSSARGAPTRWPIGYCTVLTVQVAALAVSRAKGAWVATLVAALVLAIGAMDMRGARRRFVALIAAGSLVVVVVGGAMFVRARYGTLVVGQTLQVRVVIWRDVARLIGARRDRLAFGYGPETLRSVIGPFYSPELVRLEGAFAVPDRAHNDLLDMLVTVGLLGAAAVVALHLLFWAQLIVLLGAPRETSSSIWRFVVAPLALGGAAAAVATLARASPLWLAVAVPAGLVAGLIVALASTRLRSAHAPQWLALGLLAAGVAHFVEIQVGIATVPSRLIWWCGVGIAVASARERRALTSTERGAGPSSSISTLTAAAAMTALVFDFWQPRIGLTGEGLSVILATGAIAATIDPGWRIAHVRVIAGRLSAQIAIAAAMMACLAVWEAAAWRNSAASVADVAAQGDWMAHQATVSLLFFALVAGAVASAIEPRSSARGGWRRIVALGASVPIGVLLIASAAGPARADVLARLADQMADAQRWNEAEALQQRRVRLVPDSDVAWTALGGAELDLARHSDGQDRTARFDRAVSAITQARRRSPLDWFHPRNQASVERVWAAADRRGRAAHLAAADALFREAAALAPAFPRLWTEWGNVDAERGAMHDAFVKLERAAALNDGGAAMTVADAIFRATGVDLGNPNGRALAVAQLNRDGCPTLAALYAARGK